MAHDPTTVELMTRFPNAIRISVTPARTNVSAVMPVHNEADVLDDVLNSVKEQTHPPDELVLVFDRCTDQSRQVARERASQEVVVDFGNTGAAVRAGIERARFGTIVLFDGNTLVPPTYLELLLREFAKTRADITEWHGGMMLLPKSTVEKFGPPSEKALWTLELFLRVKARGGIVVHLNGPFVRLKPSPLRRNFRYGLDYADLCWQYGLSPFFRVGTKSGLVQDMVATAGTLAAHMKSGRLIPAISKSLEDLSKTRLFGDS